nr:acyltransferase family protein [uncultured Roseibium sp.]
MSHPKYRADIDGLRALAVVPVVAFHAFPAWMPGGFIGVDVFFVISGFLISTIIFENLDRGTFSFVEFYSRRIKRIFPALLLVLVACFAFGWFTLLADEYMQLGKHIAAGAGFVSNFVFWSEAGYFDNAAETKPLLHLWSLGIEEQFYIVWPMLLWIAWKRGFNLLTLAVVLALVSFLLNLDAIGQDPVAAFYSPQTRFWELMSGSVLAWLTRYKWTTFSEIKPRIDGWLAKAVYREETVPDGRTLSNTTSFLGSALLVFGFWKISKDLSFPGFWAVVPVLGAVFIIVAGPGAWINRKILANKVAIWFGLISYPLYLWHWPLLSFARVIEGQTPGLMIRLGAVVLSVGLAWLTYRLVERPIRVGGYGRIKVTVLILLMCVVGFFGYNTYSRDGLPFRSITANLRNLSQLTYFFPTTSACSANHPYALETCYESEKKYPETVALVGDSHMMALTHGFKHLFDENKLDSNVIAIGKVGCNPFLNTDSITFKKISFGCKDVITPAIRNLIQRDDVKWVLLVGRHAGRFTGKPFGEIEKEYLLKPWTYTFLDGSLQSNSNQEAFELGLQHTVDEIVKAGKKVIFVHQFPEMGFDIRGCLDRFGTTKSDKCALDVDIVTERLTPYKDSVERIVAANPNVFQYDPMNLVCDDNVCDPFNEDGLLYYRDDDHMSKLGAEAVAQEISREILSGAK